MRRKGFTLIELVMVIVILGIMAGVAIPQFSNLSTEANTGAANGVGAALSSAMTMNFAVRSANPTGGVAVDMVGCFRGGNDPRYT